MEQESMLKSIVVLERGSEYRVLPTAEIPNELDNFNRIVGGYIEVIYLDAGRNIAIVLNEEGKIMGLEPTINIGHDVLVGTVFFVGSDNENGEFRSLTELEHKTVMDWLEGKIIE